MTTHSNAIPNSEVVVPLDRLIADERFQPRTNGKDEQHLKLLLASDPATWPPLLVTPSETGEYLIIDGFHRYAAAQRLGMKELPCSMLYGAGYDAAFAANLKHGLPLSIDDRKAYARWVHEHYPDLSYREIGRRCSLNDKTVKAALMDAGAENPRAGRGVRTNTDPIIKLMTLAVQAVQDGTGTSKLAQFFSRKTDRQQRAAYVSTVLSSIEDDQQYDVAEALYAFSLALYDATQPLVIGGITHNARVRLALDSRRYDDTQCSLS